MSSDLVFSTMSKILTGVSTCLHNNIQLLVEGSYRRGLLRASARHYHLGNR